MKGEIPVFKRCCFCFPLRYGLLVWGYLKLTADAFIITTLSYSMAWTVMSMSRIHSGSIDDVQSRFYQEMIIPVIAFAVFVTDFMVTIGFIVGGHKKNVKLIRAFYFISIAMWIFTLLLTLTFIVIMIESFIRFGSSAHRVILTLSFHFITLVVQTYFIFLLRSEIIKLKDIGEFRFVNNAAEAECTMKCEDVAATGETEIVEHV